MHRRRPALHIPLPSLDAGLVTNLVVVLGLLAVCVSVGFLTDWRWGLLAGGTLAVVAGVYVQYTLRLPVEQEPGKVTPIRKATG